MATVDDLFKLINTETKEELKTSLGNDVYSFVQPNTQGTDTVAVNVDATALAAGRMTGNYAQTPNSVTLKQRILKYRNLHKNFMVQQAVEQIVEQAIVSTNDDQLVKLDFDEEFAEEQENLVEIINDELQTILKLYDSKALISDLFRSWYVDSIIAFHKIYDPKNKKAGILELRRIESTCISRVQDSYYKLDSEGNQVWAGNRLYYKLEAKNGNTPYPGFLMGSTSRIMQVPKELIVYVDSNLYDENKNTISYLEQAIKPVNVYESLKDFSLIHRIISSMDRKAFYFEMGRMMPSKAQEELKKMMAQHKNEVNYDFSSGIFKNGTKHLGVTDNYYFARSGNKNTEVIPIPGSDNGGSLDELEFYKAEAHKALRLPISRLDSNGAASIVFGRESEITRDELMFEKMIIKLRRIFSNLFIDPLKTQLILKGIVTESEWEEIKNNFKLIFATDSYYTDIKEQQILTEKLDVMIRYSSLVDQRFITREFLWKNALKLTDEEIDEMLEIMSEEQELMKQFFTEAEEEVNKDGRS